jgi:hypothetical protein
MEPLAFTPLGYPADEAPEDRPRKALADLMWRQE